MARSYPPRWCNWCHGMQKAINKDELDHRIAAHVKKLGDFMTQGVDAIKAKKIKKTTDAHNAQKQSELEDIQDQIALLKRRAETIRANL